MPPRAGHDVPVLVSSAEGSLGRCPAGSTAAPEASPLTGVANTGSTSTSTKQFDGHPGLGQLQAKGHVSAAAAASPGAPSRPESNHQPEEHQTPEVLRQSNAATSSSVRLSSMKSLEQRKRACAVKATGPQSTQVRVVSLESPTPNPIPVEGAPVACRVSSKDYTVGKRSPLAAAALRLTVAQRTRELAKVRVAAAMTPGLSPGGQSKQPAAALATAVDPSYSQPSQAKSLVGPTDTQHPSVPVESAGQARAQEPAVLVAAAAVELQLAPGRLQQPAAALATAASTSYSQPNQAKSLVDPTYIPLPGVFV